MTLSFQLGTHASEGEDMLGIGRRDGAVEVKHTVKTVLGPPPARNSAVPTTAQGALAPRAPAAAGIAPREPLAPSIPLPKEGAAASPARDLPEPPGNLAEAPGSKLFVGVNIKLK